MLVRFWGTRGSLAKAGRDTVRFGGNTSCVEVRSAAGTLIVLDCGTGAHGLGQALEASRTGPLTGHLLVTHTHWDHIQGLPFFAPFFAPGDHWDVYGPRGVGGSLQGTLAGQMQYAYFPITLEDLKARIRYHDLVEGVFEAGDVRVTARYLNHPALTLGYRLEADGVVVAYMTDHEPHSRQLALGDAAVRPQGEDLRHAEFVAGADLLIHDAQYTADEYPARAGWGHSTVEYVADLARAAGVRKLALFHHDPLRGDAAVDALERAARGRIGQAGVEVFAAAEGGLVELMGPLATLPPEGPPAPPAARDAPHALQEHSVLVAVREPGAASLLEEAVRADGFRLVGVDGAGPGPLLEAARSARPALLLLGREPASPDAAALCRAVRAEGLAWSKDAAIVIVNEAEDAGAARAEAAAGGSDWLQLPCSDAYARTRIRCWLLRTACRWQRAPAPDDEAERLRTLRRLGVLDTEAEERFDRLTRLAAAAFDVPIALVSLVDAERQWFKSAHGIGIREGPRDQAFCAHAIRGAEVMVVPDTRLDPRFADNPVVTGGPRVRFYAGFPLAFDGHRVGTLCLIDQRPRELDLVQVRLLRDLGELVRREILAGRSPE